MFSTTIALIVDPQIDNPGNQQIEVHNLDPGFTCMCSTNHWIGMFESTVYNINYY